MKLIASGLWPRQAHVAVAAHNKQLHSGRAIAYIYVDRSTRAARRWVPEYEVRCPACPAYPAEEQLCLPVD